MEITDEIIVEIIIEINEINNMLASDLKREEWDVKYLICPTES